MDILMVLMQTINDALPAIRVIVYPVVTFREKTSIE
jgi:hypothetical protein